MFAPGDKVGNYTILRKLGEGGMGEVYLAEHGRIARQAAIKVLRKNLSEDEDIVTRFFTEARAASLIHHPGIVQILDCDVHSSGRAFIVMEYLEGESLEACLDRIGSLSTDVRTAVGILEQIADALDAAHAKGIVHRDLKPANIYLAHDPEQQGPLRVKILDFGIAKLVAGGNVSNTRTGSLLGTPLYMSPEQCRGSGQVDHRTDIYSLGCIGFEMLAGKPPFVREGYGDLLIAHASEAPPHISTYDPNLPAPVAQLVMAMLAKSPDERPQSMKAVAQQLRRWHSGDPVGSTIELSASMRRPVPPVASPGFVLPDATARLPPSSGVSPPVRSRVMAGKETTLSNTASELSSLPGRATSGGKRWVVAATTIFALVLVGAGLLLWQGQGSRKERSSTVRPLPTVTEHSDFERPTTSRVATQPSTVSIAVSSSPAGARVWVGKEPEPRGVTPLTITTERSIREVDVRLTLEGHADKSTTVSAEQDRAIDLALEKIPGKGPTRTRSRRPSAADSDYRKLGD